jgi:hypothetical protein
MAQVAPNTGQVCMNPNLWACVFEIAGTSFCFLMGVWMQRLLSQGLPKHVAKVPFLLS